MDIEIKAGIASLITLIVLWFVAGWVISGLKVIATAAAIVAGIFLALFSAWRFWMWFFQR